MCDLVTALTVGATIYGGMQQKQMMREQATVASQTAAYNARLQENEAQQLKNQGIQEENRQRRMTAELLSQQRAQLGAQGVVVDSGSALQLQEDTVDLGEADALQIRKNFEDQYSAAMAGADLTRYEGEAENARLKAEGNAAFTNSVLSAGGTVASKWYTPKSSAVQSGGGTTTNNKYNIRGGGNIHSSRYIRSQRV